MTTSGENHRIRPDVELAYEVSAFLAKSNKAAGTLRFYREKLSHALAFFAAREVDSVADLKPADVRAYLSSLKEKHTLGGQHAHYRALRAFLKWCGREYELPNDPLRNVDTSTNTSVPFQATDLPSRSCWVTRL